MVTAVVGVVLAWEAVQWLIDVCWAEGPEDIEVEDDYYYGESSDCPDWGWRYDSNDGGCGDYYRPDGNHDDGWRTGAQRAPEGAGTGELPEL